MKFMKGLLLGITFTLLFHILLFGWSDWKGTVQNQWDAISKDTDFLRGLTDKLQESRQDNEGSEDEALQSSASSEASPSSLSHASNTMDGETQSFTIGMGTDQVEDELGAPQRIDPSAYGYEWWIYHDQDWQNYIQVGVENQEVVTFYTNAPGWEYAGLQTGMSVEEWDKYEKRNLEQIENGHDMSFQHELGYYTLNLTEQDMQEKPLLIEDNVAIQIYVDIHEQETVSGIRVMDLDTLLMHRPYAMRYVGTMPDQQELNEQEQQEVATAHEQQVLDLVNVSRHAFDLEPLEWHEHTSNVARSHSEDMHENEYFDHISPENGDLSNRLDEGGVEYRGAGENIAWNYTDAPDTHHGWLNSPGHRKNVIEPSFTHLGVGVVDQYYTQNFIRK